MNIRASILMGILMMGPSLWATTYYMSPTGSDVNNGTTSDSSWVSPHHALNCGDVIIAAAGSYSASNFGLQMWGTVTCAAGNNVAWLECAIFDACKISITSGRSPGMQVGASYWGVQGWEVDNTAGGAAGGACFSANPPSNTTIHHIIFANNIANVCPRDAFGGGPHGYASIDYLVIVGNISYKAAGTNTGCNSGIDIYEPVASDALPGTHIYVAGNFIFGTSNPAGCWDGEGIIFDTFDGDQTHLPASYVQQAVIENNISVSNGSNGILIEYNDAGVGPDHSPTFVAYNTLWNNNGSPLERGSPFCGELYLYKTANTDAYRNLAATGQTGCFTAASNPAYAYAVRDVDGTSVAYQDLGWSATGSYSQIISSTGFSYGPDNLFGSNPGFANAETPGAPSCGTASSVPNCMATVIANFTPTNEAAIGYGYQIPSTTLVYDPLFPQWLCNVNLPAGLVGMGCFQLKPPYRQPTTTYR